ncbi:MAG TPA: hypothetical protein ENK18_14505 [Deltaproteobacteria bacterium]|nr:hypothetical protein [Deltaproteobacteria bacterium]
MWWSRGSLLCLVLSGCNENQFSISNARPEVIITSHLDGDPVVEGIPFRVRGVAGDADHPSDSLVATWFAAGAPVAGCTQVPLDEEGNTECDVILFMNTQPWRIQIEVRDPRGSVGTATVGLEVVPGQAGFGAPLVEITSPTDAGVGNEGDPLQFTAQVSDAEDNAASLALYWSSDRDGGFSNQGADSNGTSSFIYADLTPGPHVITLTATDTEGNFATDIVTYRINGVPSAPVVTITPETPGSNQDLQASIDVPGIDPEGDPVSHTYEWLKDGVVQPSLASSLVLNSETTRGETWTVRVYPHDADATGPHGEASVVVRNAPPEVLSATLSPDPALTDDVLQISATTDDVDGDALTVSYDWQINGAFTGTGGTTLDGALSFERGDQIQVLVTANDGSADSVTVPSNLVTIGNSPPTVPAVAIAPTDPIEQLDALYCSALGSTDPDGDSITYTFSWTIDGASYPRASDLGPFTTTWPDDGVLAVDTTEGEGWTCEVTAVDALGSPSLPGSDTVIVAPDVFLPNYNGTFDVTPDPFYTCAGGLVRVDITQLTFSVAGDVLLVGGGPVVMTQDPAPTDENFNATGVIAGGCTETYTISGSFTDPDHFVGSFTASFNGFQCSVTNCNNQAFAPLYGTRL